MNFTEYSPLALRTAKPLPYAKQVTHAFLGLITETGELADTVKRHVIYGQPLNKVNLMEEVGDVFWYLNLLAHELRGNLTADAAAGLEDRPLEDLVLLLHKHNNMLLEVADAYTGQLLQGAARLLLQVLVHSDHTLPECLEANIEKLAKRYPDKYTDHAALNRDTLAELAVLEAVKSA